MNSYEIYSITIVVGALLFAIIFYSYKAYSIKKLKKQLEDKK